MLLEKVKGNIFIDKMRAICLLEADYNWLNKLVYAKWMMDRAYDAGIVPAEQFARRGVQAAEGVLTTSLFSDIVRVMHRTAAIESVDLANCYDAVAHPIASIALQSFKVRQTTVAMMLYVLQTMKFYLRTAYGQSESSYGGTKEDPTMGLAQGNGAAPPGFLAVATLMINAYKRLGHGVDFITPWTGDAFYLAAILFVDDSDLLHLASLTESDDEFFERIQEATFDWGGLVQATGGLLKPSKCFWYMLSWKWKKGEPILQKIPTLQSVPLRIPQPDGSIIPIPLRPVDHPEKKLGVWTTANGDFGHHLSTLREKGVAWAAKMQSGRCPPRDVWLGLKHQLYRQLSYGFVTLVHPPSKVDKVFHQIWYKCLPALKVNRCLRREWRMLPLRFQGLALPNPNIDILCSKMHALSSHWSSDSVISHFLRHAYQAFQVEVGLGGNIFALPFKQYGALATNGWFKHLWELCDRYGVTYRIHPRYDIPLLRYNDSTIMDKATRLGIYSMPELCVINRVRRYKKVHSMGDVIMCDGRNVSPDMLTQSPGESSREFPIEKPTSSNFRLWNECLHALTSQQLRLFHRLGDYISSPHGKDSWFTCSDRSELYRITGPNSYDLFTRESAGVSTRRGAKYIQRESHEGHCIKLYRASVRPVMIFSHPSSTQVRLHSLARVYNPPDDDKTILERLKSWENRTLWSTFKCDDDGEWIYRAIYLGSLVIAHDGSYMSKVAPDVCSAAVVLHCKLCKKYASVTWVEKTTKKGADNYRAEILGGIAAQLIVKAALTNRRRHSSMRVRVGCDNLGVVNHGNKARRPLYERQSQADVLRLFKQLVAQSLVPVEMYHIYGHMDELLPFHRLTLEERLNCRADELASEALLAAISTQLFISSNFPFEDIRVFVGGKKIIANPRRAISNHWGGKVARELYHDRSIIHKRDFHLVYWDGVEEVMASYPEMFQTWVTKHVSHFCGTNRQLSRIDSEVSNACPSCGSPDESPSHITKCLETGRTAMFEESIKELETWLRSQRTGRQLTNLITSYLRARSSHTLSSLLPPNSPFTLLARFHDRLGWDNFLEGRISSLWVEMRHLEVEADNLRTTAEYWARGLIRRLVQITHRQWIYRNSAVHLKVRGSLSQPQHEKLMDTIEDYLHVDPMSLLPEDRRLLTVDLEALAESSPVNQQTWVAEMETAVSAASHIRSGSRQAINSRYCSGPQPLATVVEEFVEVDSEGSMRWRRRRRRN